MLSYLCLCYKLHAEVKALSLNNFFFPTHILRETVIPFTVEGWNLSVDHDQFRPNHRLYTRKEAQHLDRWIEM